jgi:A/G-specific adenine glycosylase
VTELAKELLIWFESHGRKNLPWQSSPPNIYHIWLSEVMLQQTQVSTVKGYFNDFIKAFPDIHALASASEDKVMALWAGLGYYSRARNLHKTAKIVVFQVQWSFS